MRHRGGASIGKGQRLYAFIRQRLCEPLGRYLSYLNLQGRHLSRCEGDVSAYFRSKLYLKVNLMRAVSLIEPQVISKKPYLLENEIYWWNELPIYENDLIIKGL